jgi:hypothetical protein
VGGRTAYAQKFSSMSALGPALVEILGHPGQTSEPGRLWPPHAAPLDSTCASNAYGLIALLRELRVPVIVISSSIAVPLPISLSSLVMLEGLFAELQLFGCLRAAKEVPR